MIKPPFLNPGDTIAIAGPAGKINQNIVNEAAMVLETWGLKVKIANNLFKNHFGNFD